MSSPVTIFAGDKYLVDVNGNYFYPLLFGTKFQNSTPLKVVLAEGQKVIGGANCWWLVTPGPVEHIHVLHRFRGARIGWKLNSAVAPAELELPETLPTEAFSGVSPHRQFYSKSYEEDTITILNPATGHLSQMPGAPDTEPDIHWEADQPLSIMYGNNFHHLIPGRSYGLHERMLRRLTATFGAGKRNAPGVHAYQPTSRQSTIDVTFDLVHSVPNWASDTRLSLSDPKPDPEASSHATTRSRVLIQVSPWSFVDAGSKAAAIVEMDRQIDEWIEYLRGYQRVRPCHQCSGVGSIPESDSEPAVPPTQK